jgi:hypothetical protein
MPYIVRLSVLARERRHARRRCDGRRVDSLIVSQKLIVLHDEQIGYLDPGKNCRVVFVTANILAIGTLTQQYGEHSTDLDSILLDST